MILCGNRIRRGQDIWIFLALVLVCPNPVSCIGEKNVVPRRLSKDKMIRPIEKKRLTLRKNNIKRSPGKDLQVIIGK